MEVQEMMENQEINAPEKSKKKLPLRLIVLLLAVILVVVVGVALFSGDRHAYTVNGTDKETGLETAEGFWLFTSGKADVTFQYPASCLVVWDEADGAYLYAGAAESSDYVLIHRKNQKGMTPEKYFDSCTDMMLDSFDKVSSSEIHEAPVEEKTLYMVRYLCQKGGQELVIDRYLELYKKCYVEYTAVSDTKGSLDTELYYAIATLRTNTDAYAGAYSDKTTAYDHPDMGMHLSIPDMMDTKELTIGYFASSQDAVMLSVLLTTDDQGKTIYNRQDFIDRAAQSSTFVAGQLGADSVTFEDGREVRLDGRSFYVYPMQMNSGGTDYEGELYLANADDTGCYVICYAAREGSPAKEDILSLCSQCAESIRID